MQGWVVFPMLFLYSSYIRPICVLYKSYIKPLYDIVFTGLGRGQSHCNSRGAVCILQFLREEKDYKIFT